MAISGSSYQNGIGGSGKVIADLVRSGERPYSIETKGYAHDGSGGKPDPLVLDPSRRKEPPEADTKKNQVDTVNTGRSVKKIKQAMEKISADLKNPNLPDIQRKQMEGRLTELTTELGQVHQAMQEAGATLQPAAAELAAKIDPRKPLPATAAAFSTQAGKAGGMDGHRIGEGRIGVHATPAYGEARPTEHPTGESHVAGGKRR